MRFFALSVMAFFMKSLALAAEAVPAATPAAGQAANSPANPLQTMAIPILMIIMMFYFIILRPQKAEQRKHEALLNSVTKGDAVVTSAGIFGTVESVDATKGIITVTVAPKVNIKFSRSAITQVTKKKDLKEGENESGNAS